ncbi:MAG: sodium/solute symporter [Candidatus Omnitrophica bacterium]|nr:sodium/solute symporter [Candidatus Omnitrophota bacterium]
MAGGYEWIACLCLLFLAVVFIPQYLRTRIYTIPEFLERRFSLAARMYLSVYFTVMIVLTKVSIALYAGALVVETVLGWDETTLLLGLPAKTTTMILIGLFTGLYTAMGGLAAVVYTDALQVVVLVLGSVILTLVGLDKVGGWAGLIENANVPVEHLSMVKPVTHPDYPITGYFIGNLFGAGMFYWCMDQSIVQRALGAKSIDHGRKGAILAGFLKITPVFIFVLPGVIALALFPGIENDAAFPTMVSNLLPVGVRGIVLAGLLAALMSSLDSTLNASATLVTRDFIVRFSGVEPGQRAQIWIGRVTIAIVLAAGILCTPLIETQETLWLYLQQVSAYMGMPMAVAVFTGILWRRANNMGALACMVVGTLLGIFMMADSSTDGGMVGFLQADVWTSFLHRSILVAIVSIAVMISVSLATSPPPVARTEGVCYEWGRPDPERGRGISDYRVWAGILFVLVMTLWVVFR